MKRRTLVPSFIVAAFLLACSCMPLSFFSPDEAPPDQSPDEPSNQPVAAPGDGSGDSQAPAGYEQALTLAGHWTGTWSNTTYGSTGGIDVTIDVQPDGTASLTLNMTGNVLGAGSAPEVSIPGYYLDNGLFFEAPNAPVFGNIMVAIGIDGSLAMQATVLPVASIASVAARGEITGDEIVLDYLVVSSNNVNAVGTANMTRTP